MLVIAALSSLVNENHTCNHACQGTRTSDALIYVILHLHDHLCLDPLRFCLVGFDKHFLTK